MRKSKFPDEVGDREVERSQPERAENYSAIRIPPGGGLPHQNICKRASKESAVAVSCSASWTDVCARDTQPRRVRG
jgi:hypothetical protein